MWHAVVVVDVFLIPQKAMGIILHKPVCWFHYHRDTV